MSRSSAALAREMRLIRSHFHQLARSFGRIAPYLVEVPKLVEEAAGSPARRKPRLSRQQRAALKLQGKYMGTMRGLKPRQRAKVKRIRAARGIKAAIRVAKGMAK